MTVATSLISTFSGFMISFYCIINFFFLLTDSLYSYAYTSLRFDKCC